jgi:hypothetical protein
MRRRAALLLVACAALCAAVPDVASAALPVIDYSLSGTAGTNGWFVSDVTVSWSVTFQGTPVSSSGCEAAIALTAETTGTTRTCSATNTEGTTTAVTRVIKIDKTPPAVTGAAAARPPDTNGFYRTPVGVAWSGTDGTSGIAACTSLTYGGPDGPASPAGTCTDQAGNASAPVPFALSYDATPPALTGTAAVGGDGLATVRWTAGADAQAVTVTRAPGDRGAPTSVVYQGRAARFVDTGLRNGTRYTYSITATDAATNATTAAATATPRSMLLAPAPGARLSHPPVLRWKRVRHARYYNVQIFRGGRKVLSAWPTRTALQLHRRWRFGGHRRHLARGRYRWFVWPGFGRRSRHRYGAVLGLRRFTIR